MITQFQPGCSAPAQVFHRIVTAPSRPLPLFRPAGRSRLPAGARRRYWLNLEIREKSGKYIEMTMPPTRMPRKTIITGSRAASMFFTA